MSESELIKFSGPEELAKTAAEAFLGLMGPSEGHAATSGPRPSLLVALLGGRIAGRFFSAVADLSRVRGLTLRAVHFFWSDERCVPPDDPESNFALARRQLLAPMAIRERQIHRLRGEEAPETAATEAEAELRRLVGAVGGSENQPVFDLVFLGLGEDGHVASLFPGEPEEAVSSRAVYRSVTAVKPPPRRITLGYPAIAAARRVWVLASGPGKERALRESLAPQGQTPLARVLKSRGQTRIFTDIGGVRRDEAA